MVIIAVLGASGSGKTTTIEYLISHLAKEGFRIGSIKHIHRPDFPIDTVGKDTWRYTNAGAVVTMAIAPKEIAIIKRLKEPFDSLDQITSLLEKEELDVIFIEGLKSLVAQRRDIPKIITSRNQRDLREMLNETSPPILAISGLVAKKKVQTREFETPIIDLPDDGDLLLNIVKNHITHKNER
jgi:molybdopterin-guanine dinucleotide biosynthesis protein B